MFKQVYFIIIIVGLLLLSIFLIKKNKRPTINDTKYSEIYFLAYDSKKFKEFLILKEQNKEKLLEDLPNLIEQLLSDLEQLHSSFNIETSDYFKYYSIFVQKDTFIELESKRYKSIKNYLVDIHSRAKAKRIQQKDYDAFLKLYASYHSSLFFKKSWYMSPRIYFSQSFYSYLTDDSDLVKNILEQEIIDKMFTFGLEEDSYFELSYEDIQNLSDTFLYDRQLFLNYAPTFDIQGRYYQKMLEYAMSNKGYILIGHYD